MKNSCQFLKTDVFLRFCFEADLLDFIFSRILPLLWNVIRRKILEIFDEKKLLKTNLMIM